MAQGDIDTHDDGTGFNSETARAAASPLGASAMPGAAEGVAAPQCEAEATDGSSVASSRFDAGSAPAASADRVAPAAAPDAASASSEAPASHAVAPVEAAAAPDIAPTETAAAPDAASAETAVASDAASGNASAEPFSSTGGPAAADDAGASSPAPAAAPAAAPNADRVVDITFYHVLWIFVVCSVLGLVVETLVSYPLDGVWKDRAGLVWGPFSPIYGLGAVLITLLFNRTKRWPAAAVFLAAALFGGVFELVAGWFFKHAFGIVAWSYIDQPFNIAGYTCLGIAVCWGVLGLVWMRVLLPPFARLLDRVPRRFRALPTAVATAFLAVDVVLTLGAFNCWFERQAGEPVQTGVQQFFAQHFDDEFMEERFETMSLWAEIATRPDVGD